MIFYCMSAFDIKHARRCVRVLIEAWWVVVLGLEWSCLLYGRKKEDERKGSLDS